MLEVDPILEKKKKKKTKGKRPVGGKEGK